MRSHPEIGIWEPVSRTPCFGPYLISRGQDPLTAWYLGPDTSGLAVRSLLIAPHIWVGNNWRGHKANGARIMNGRRRLSTSSLRNFFTRRPFCRQRLPTIQSSTFDLLLHIRDRSNIYPRPEERLDEGCGGEKGGLRLHSGGGLFADKDTLRGYTERVDKQGS